MRCVEPETLGREIVRWLMLHPDGATRAEIADAFPTRLVQVAINNEETKGNIRSERVRTASGGWRLLYFATIKARGAQRKLEVFVRVPA